MLQHKATTGERAVPSPHGVVSTMTVVKHAIEHAHNVASSIQKEHLLSIPMVKQHVNRTKATEQTQK